MNYLRTSVSMTKELKSWQFIAERLMQNQRVGLLVVAESSGSSPGRQGFKMAVTVDEIAGSVGGGVMEVSLVESARKKLDGRGQSSEVIEQIHQKDSPNTSGMICSGKQTVVLIRLDLGNLETVNKIVFSLKNNQPKVLKISNSEFQIADETSEDFKYKFERGDDIFLFSEKLGVRNKLFIVGGGHCALALSELMSKMDFHISLFDDRPNLNTLAKNEFVDEKRILDSYENIGGFVSSGDDHYVVVMTLGYKFDEVVIRELFDKEFKYFGVLGSKVKMAVLFSELEKEGFDKNRLDKIHTPIGVRINSQTPEEIAVSIAAEIIAVKNSKG